MVQLSGSGMFIEKIKAAGFRSGCHPSTTIQNVFGITIFGVSAMADN